MLGHKPPIEKIIFDLDGVVYRGHTPVPGAGEAIGKIRSAGISISFITNNATRSRKQLQKRLGKFGIRAKKEEIMTSAYSCACYLNSLKPKPKKLFAIGEKGLRDELRSCGFEVLHPTFSGEKPSATTFSHLSSGEKKPRADYLVSGLDRKITYAKLAAAIDVLESGAKWAACNLDPTLPMENGFHPGSGSIGASIAYTMGKPIHHSKIGQGALFSNIKMREPDFVAGKPNLYMLKLLAGKIPSKKSGKIMFVGDRLDIDMAFANSANLTSILVLSGVSNSKDAKKAKGKLKPDFILNSVKDLPKFLKI